MSRSLFEPLPDDAFVFRLAETGKLFLPRGALLPNAEFFHPSSEDEREAEKSGRSPGVSVWDRELTTVENAKRIRFSPGDLPDGVRAFGLLVKVVRSIGQKRAVAVDVVAVPLPPNNGPGADGHAHIEGLERKKGQPRLVIKGLRADLAEACEEVA